MIVYKTPNRNRLEPLSVCRGQSPGGRGHTSKSVRLGCSFENLYTFKEFFCLPQNMTGVKFQFFVIQLRWDADLSFLHYFPNLPEIMQINSHSTPPPKKHSGILLNPTNITSIASDPKSDILTNFEPQTKQEHPCPFCPVPAPGGWSSSWDEKKFYFIGHVIKIKPTLYSLSLLLKQFVP